MAASGQASPCVRAWAEPCWAWSKAYGGETRRQRGRPPYSYRHSEATTGRPFRWSSRAASGCQDGGAPCRTWRCGHRTPWPRTSRNTTHSSRRPSCLLVRTGVARPAGTCVAPSTDCDPDGSNLHDSRSSVPCSVFACHPAIPTLFLPVFSSLCSMHVTCGAAG